MPAPPSPHFALNHIVAPRLGLAELCRLAAGLAITRIEIRNDLPGQPVADGTPPEAVAAAAARSGVTIISINALQRFDDWGPAREREARELARYAEAAGARALVLVPTNDGSGRARDDRGTRLQRALRGLRPILADHGLLGLVEPLGFETSSLRFKAEAAEAIEAAGGQSFRLVHDTFHHALAAEAELVPSLTGLVHISGVNDVTVPRSGMRDLHRGLVDPGDRLDTVGQIAALVAAGYDGPFSFEPFADEVHALSDPRAAIAASMDHIRTRLATLAH
jgi:2-keto-myo-inositol isomerase